MTRNAVVTMTGMVRRLFQARSVRNMKTLPNVDSIVILLMLNRGLILLLLLLSFFCQLLQSVVLHYVECFAHVYGLNGQQVPMEATAFDGRV